MKKITLEQHAQIHTDSNEFVDGVYAVADSTLFQVVSHYGGSVGSAHVVIVSDATDAYSPSDLSMVIEDVEGFEGMRETEYFLFDTREQALSHYFELQIKAAAARGQQA